MGMTAALKSFLGHLQGSGKANHTVNSYRFDLLNFTAFLESTRAGKKPLEIRALSRRDLERYQDWLKHSGQKANTRRRKVMTVRKLMHYLTSRKKLDLDIGKRLPAPEKIERVPETIDLEKFRETLLGLAAESSLLKRNIALVGFLADTGCGVAEAAKLRWSQVDLKTGRVEILGKSERILALSSDVTRVFASLREENRSDELCFLGFNRHGPMRVGKRALGITPRGVELVVKTLSESLGFPGVTPRTLRHSAVVAWYREGSDEKEIQRRLGLKTPYAFRIYAPIFAGIRDARSKSSSAATSNA